MRYVTAGESHGRALVTIVSGVPAGVPLLVESIDADLARRQVGHGRGGRMTIETDKATILSGVRFGRTLGSPVALIVTNRDWDNWTDIMASAGDKPEGIALTMPRPGHADLSGALKYGTDDVRDILERASARETAARVAAGAVAKSFLAALGVTVASFVDSIGGESANIDGDPGAVDSRAVEQSRVRCPDSDASSRMIAAIDAARAEGESLGGTFVVTATGLVSGLGTHVEADRRLDSALAGAMISIPAIKGVEFGDGFELASRRGSGAHDEISFGESVGYTRKTNRAGGLEGGMSNGETLVIRAAMKPIPTLMKPLQSVDIVTHERVGANKERSDVCAVPAAAVVGEAEVAMVLARAYMEKFGCDSLEDIVAGLSAYRERIRS